MAEEHGLVQRGAGVAVLHAQYPQEFVRLPPLHQLQQLQLALGAREVDRSGAVVLLHRDVGVVIQAQ